MKLRSIQALRGIAAALVVGRHLFGWPVGIAGVDIFFVISGFIMATIAPGALPRLFLARRLARIYPLWWLCVAPAIFGLGLASGFDGPRVWASVLLVPMGRATLPYLDVGWSLMFEVLFYLAVAITLWVRSLVPMLGLFAGMFALNIMSPMVLTGYLGHPLILEFLAGAAIVLLPRTSLVGVAALGMALFLFILHRHDEVAFAWSYGERAAQLARVLTFGPPALLTVYGCLCIEEQFAGRLWSPLVTLGDASYSLYLTHLGVRLLGGPPELLFALSIAVGVLVHRLVERPLTSFMTGRRVKRTSRLSRPPELA